MCKRRQSGCRAGLWILGLHLFSLLSFILPEEPVLGFASVVGSHNPRGRRAACGKQRVSHHMFNVSQAMVAMAAMLVSDPLAGHLSDS